MLTVTFDPNIFKRTAYHFTHNVYDVREIGTSYQKREVAVESKNTDPPAADARACIRAFEILALDDRQTATCRVLVNRTSYARFKAGDLSCELARAVQTPYGKAKDAEIVINTGSLCALFVFREST